MTKKKQKKKVSHILPLCNYYSLFSPFKIKEINIELKNKKKEENYTTYRCQTFFFPFSFCFKYPQKFNFFLFSIMNSISCQYFFYSPIFLLLYQYLTLILVLYHRKNEGKNYDKNKKY